jgi:hypothetical protein
MALPSWRIGLVASCGSFSKRMGIANDFAAPVGSRRRNTTAKQTICFVKAFAGLS